MGDWTTWVAIGVALLIAYAVLLWLGLVVWTYFDMKDRSHDPLARWVATGAVFLFNIPGFFLYLIFRPHETLVEAYERRLEAEALKAELAEQHRTCPSCRRFAEQTNVLVDLAERRPHPVPDDYRGVVASFEGANLELAVPS